MFKALSLHRLLTPSRKIIPFVNSPLYRSTLPLQQRPLYTFTTGDRMPRNK